MAITKNLAIRIICAAPLSIELSGNYEFLFNLFLLRDKMVQDWALRQSDFFSEEDWREVQLKKLKNILAHAGSNVSYWREIFKKIDFNPKNFRDFNDLQKIPITTRAGIKKNSVKKLIAENIPSWRFKEATTSGSTGEPLNFYQDARDNLRREVNTYNELKYANATNHDHIAVLGLDNHHDLDGLGRRFRSIEWGSGDFRQSVIYPYLKLKPAVLIANGSDLRRFLFLMQQETNFDDIFKALIYRGEHLSEPERNHIFRFFKCPIFTTYGSRETSLLGVECDSHKLHLAPWMNYFEIVSDNGEVAPDGREGNVAVTFFENFVMPFIRYKIGDRAVINTELCPCGRKSKTITLHGRESEFIKFPDSDKSVAVLDLMRQIDDNCFREIKQYQFELHGERSIIFRYVPNSVITATKRKFIVDLLKEALEHQFEIILKESSVINHSKGGKTSVLLRSSLP